MLKRLKYQFCTIVCAFAAYSTKILTDTNEMEERGRACVEKIFIVTGVFFPFKNGSFCLEQRERQRRCNISVRYWWYILIQEGNCLSNRKKNSDFTNELVFSCKWFVLYHLETILTGYFKTKTKKKEKQTKKIKYCGHTVLFSKLGFLSCFLWIFQLPFSLIFSDGCTFSF